jgi:hypothetical protein
MNVIKGLSAENLRGVEEFLRVYGDQSFAASLSF